MGIKGLSQFLKKKYPQVYSKTHVREFAYKKVAIDISLYLYKFKVTNQDYWLSPFINMVRILRRNDVHCVFIYDGKAPIEKDEERQRRRQQRSDSEQNLFQVKKDLELYKMTDEVTPLLKEFNDKLEKARPMLLPNTTLRVDRIEDEINRKQAQIVYLTPQDIQLTKDLFHILSIPFIEAEGEAETLASRLCVAGLVDAVMSEDTDVLAYGTPLMISKIDLLTGEVVVVRNRELLDELLLDCNEFKDFCIMCGTDYNTNIPRVGPSRAYNLIRKYSSIDDLPLIYNVEILKHVRVRELLSSELKQMDMDIPFCGQPNLEEFLQFIRLKRIHLDQQNLKSDFFKSKDLMFT